ncbi:MAG: hypothetical protein H3C57_02030 [Gammaproteobacteria bacterium]|nr:hypothetical protein [Gammaproteobacteria bacterium]
MNKYLIAAGSAALLAVTSQAGAAPVEATLISNIQNGTSTLRWDGCTNFAQFSNCIHPANAAFAAAGIVPSTAQWTWDAATGVLSMTGSFNSASSIGSNAMSPMIIGDKVTDLTIDTVNQTVTAAAYACGEGSFLGGVGANGCMDVSHGGNFMLDSSVAYNIGGDASCVAVTLGGDDANLTGDGAGGPMPRGLTARAAGGGCNATSGAFDLFAVTTSGNMVSLASLDGSNVLNFQVVPVPGAVWLFGSALGLAGIIRRRKAVA